MPRLGHRGDLVRRRWRPGCGCSRRSSSRRRARTRRPGSRRGRRRVEVGHAEDRRHTAGGGLLGRGVDVLLVGVPGLPGVHVDVDHAGQHELAGGVERLERRAPTPVSGTMPAIRPSATSTSAVTVPAGVTSVPPVIRQIDRPSGDLRSSPMNVVSSGYIGGLDDDIA